MDEHTAENDAPQERGAGDRFRERCYRSVLCRASSHHADCNSPTVTPPFNPDAPQGYDGRGGGYVIPPETSA